MTAAQDHLLGTSLCQALYQVLCTHFLNAGTVQCKRCPCPHFMDEKAEALRAYVTFPWSQSWIPELSQQTVVPLASWGTSRSGWVTLKEPFVLFGFKSLPVKPRLTQDLV